MNVFWRTLGAQGSGLRVFIWRNRFDGYVVREDAKQLIEIKKGAWSLEKVKEESTLLFANAEEAFIHSKLPDKPDIHAAENLLARIIFGYYNIKQMRC